MIFGLFRLAETKAEETANWTTKAKAAPDKVAKVDMSKLSVEQQKAVIEANFVKGSKVYESIEIPEENKLIYYDGNWKELYALWAYNDEPVPMGEIYDINDEGDLQFLKEFVMNNEPHRVEPLFRNLRDLSLEFTENNLLGAENLGNINEFMTPLQKGISIRQEAKTLI